jgi:hypothetical protein
MNLTEDQKLCSRHMPIFYVSTHGFIGNTKGVDWNLSIMLTCTDFRKKKKKLSQLPYRWLRSYFNQLCAHGFDGGAIISHGLVKWLTSIIHEVKSWTFTSDKLVDALEDVYAELYMWTETNKRGFRSLMNLVKCKSSKCLLMDALEDVSVFFFFCPT